MRSVSRRPGAVAYGSPASNRPSRKDETSTATSRSCAITAACADVVAAKRSEITSRATSDAASATLAATPTRCRRTKRLAT
jgi:hypothetical protein